ncbi:MAG: endonuclease domain-containing protein [Candidatus Woesebacteria bacterium]|nr:endonuclease domain-containing protein [Candidatus Woesebacteria bacterium]
MVNNMNSIKNKFVFAKKRIKVSDNIYIEKNDVGIVDFEAENGASIFFIRAWKSVKLNKKDYKIFDVMKAGDAFPKKICNICHKLVNTDKFAKNQNGINNRSVRRPSCNDCRKQLEGVNVSAKTKAEWSKKKPHYVPFECPICAKRTIAGVTSKVVLDHDHRNGEPRGWVCDSCNTGIGRFKDDIGLIKRAIKFIE